jgi:hypothetical protein
MPNIKSLVRRQDVEGLLKAASYEDLAPSSVGTVRDRGILVRANAVLALARSGGRPPRHQSGPWRSRGAGAMCGRGRPARTQRGGCARTIAAVAGPGPRQCPPARFARATIDLRKSVRPSIVADALVHREDDDPLGERDAQLILTLLEGERPVAPDEVFELLVVALGDERGIVVDRAAEILVLLAPGSIGSWPPSCIQGPTPPAWPTSWGESVTHRPWTHSRRRWSMASRAFGPRAPPHWLRIKTPRR